MFSKVCIFVVRLSSALLSALGWSLSCLSNWTVHALVHMHLNSFHYTSKKKLLGDIVLFTKKLEISQFFIVMINWLQNVVACPIWSGIILIIKQI